MASTENCSSGSVTMTSPVQVPVGQGKKITFYRDEEEVGRPTVNKDSMAFHWLSCNHLSLAELLPGKKREFSSSCWTLSLQDMRASPSGLPALFS